MLNMTAVMYEDEVLLYVQLREPGLGESAALDQPVMGIALAWGDDPPAPRA
jgi:hypothetical protein